MNPKQINKPNPKPAQIHLKTTQHAQTQITKHRNTKLQS